MASDTLRERVVKFINSRPYYICKSPTGNHKDLQSQFGSMINQYSRREDKINEEYLADGFIALVESECQKRESQLLDEIEHTFTHQWVPSKNRDSNEMKCQKCNEWTFDIDKESDCFSYIGICEFIASKRKEVEE